MVMGFSNNTYIKAPDCPVCGREGSARMTSSEWLPFRGPACSHTCGILAKGRLEQFHDSREFKELMDMHLYIFERMRQLEEAAIGNFDPDENDDD